MTTNAEVKNYLQYALLQLAAESYLHDLPLSPADQRVELIRRFKFGFNDPTHPYIVGPTGRAGAADANAPVLPAQNRMVSQQAEATVDGYALMDHHANDQTGFSGSLFRKSSREYVLSFRSTEFRTAAAAGDRERDNFDGANGEIFNHGFAFGQLAAMEAYYAELKATGQIPAGTKITVTGYSLGGHMANVFTLLHKDEVAATYTYNAAGHGVLDQLPTDAQNVGRMIEIFTEFVLTPGSALAIATVEGISDSSERARLQGLQAAALARAAEPEARNPFLTDESGLSGNFAARTSVYGDARYTFAKELIRSVTESLVGQPGNVNGSEIGTDTAYGLICHNAPCMAPSHPLA